MSEKPDRYEMLEEIGKGGFATVYRGLDTVLNRTVALKELRPSLLEDEEWVRRFKREAQTIAQLDHRRIVTIFDVVDQGQRLYIVMRLINGPSLDDHLAEQGKLSWPQTLEIITAVAEALTYAHTEGILHRDLKPANILLDSDRGALLSDFGLAKLAGEAGTSVTAAGEIVGTPHYIAPEVWEGQGTSPQSDIYALGCILYEMLTGEKLFDGDSPPAIMMAHFQPLQLPQMRQGAPSTVTQILEKALSKKPDERYATAGEIVQALINLTETESAVLSQDFEKAKQDAMPRGRTSVKISLPPFLDEEVKPTKIEKSVFVARERELSRLDEFLKKVLSEQSQIVFVTGEAGQGKTSLANEFARRAQEHYADLVQVNGYCNAYAGVGDPYLPFRDVMEMLTGGVEAKWAAGVISRDQARRLWNLMPVTVQTLVADGPDLIDIFVSGAALIERASALRHGKTDWLERSQAFIDRKQTRFIDSGQGYLLEQYTRVLRALSAQRPLLIVLDDLQWADTASLSLLFHLGRRLERSRVLIVGTYRPDEVALGREGKDHPLEKVLNEFKRTFGDIWIDLAETDETEDWHFVEAILATQPNRLSEAFRQALFQHTKGHPLFTVELLKAMQERGDLVQDEHQQWIERPTLDWERLPSRVEGVIEDRVGRLDAELREILEVASVQGEIFTAEVVAHVLGIDERPLLHNLSQELKKRHRLVQEQETASIGRHLLSRYRFTNFLCQRYLYNSLSAGERRLLHSEIAQRLSLLYEDHTDEIAVQLARHYTEANQGDLAIDYLLRAGDQARLAYAFEEAIDHYQRALAFLKKQNDYERAARTMMKLGSTHHIAFDFQRARQTYDEAFILWQGAVETFPSAPSVPAPHPLRMTWFDPTTLDPTKERDQFASVIDQLFSGLVELTPELDVVPEVARSWETLEGGHRYIFHLRDDMRWSDGMPVTAENFEYAWKRTLDPATESPVAMLLYDVKDAKSFHQGESSDPNGVGVRALDQITLEVELEEPTSYFLHLLARPVSYPLPSHAVELYGEAWTDEGNIITNGPFRLRSWKRADSMVLVRNPDYQGRSTGNVEEVELTLLPDRSVYLDTYERDRLDVLWVGLLSLPDRDRALRWHTEDFFSAPWAGSNYIGFDVSRSPFDDPRIRRAFVLAVDREPLADIHLRGISFPALGGSVPPWMPGHSAGIGLSYDPGQAQQLLAEAGYPGSRGFPAVDALVHRDSVLVSEYLKEQWQENLGIGIKWKTVESEMFFRRMERNRPHISLPTDWIADYPDPDDVLRVSLQQHSTGWQNETYDRLVEEARQVTDQSERMRMYQAADKILVEEVPIIPLLYGRLKLLVKPWVRRYPTSAIKWCYWKDVIIEPH